MYLDGNECMNTDMIFINGFIHSIDRSNNIYESMAINNGEIVALGNNDEVLKYLGKKTKIIDLNHKTIIPAFIDAHCHVPEEFIMQKDGLKLFEGNTVEEYCSLINKYIYNHPDKKIIYGVGLRTEIVTNENNYIGFNKFYKSNWLDKIKTNKPIVLKDYSNNALLLNTKALNYFNITKEMNIPIGGSIELNAKGEISGILKGSAMNLIPLNECEKYKDKDYINGFLKYQEKLHSYGVTTINPIEDDSLSIPIEIYRRLEIMNKLKLRINYGVKILPGEVCKKTVYEQLHNLKRNRIIYKTDLFDLSVAEFIIDGIEELEMSYLFKPYRSFSKDGGENRGQFMWHLIELGEGIKMANRLDFNVDINARGDNACKLAIDEIEYSEKNNDNHNYRNSLVNIDLITRYYMRRMKSLGINAIVKPYWFYKNDAASECESKLIGEDRTQRLYPFKSLIDTGIVTASSSDYYVCNCPNPLNAIRCAVCRNLYDIIPEKVNMNASKYRLNPCERVSVLDAIKSFTINSAYILGKEKDIGSLEVGKKADFIILDKDIFNTHPLDIDRIKINSTYFNGQLVYAGN